MNDNATLKVSSARFYRAPSGTERPIGAAALKQPPAPWVEYGHTSLDQILEITSEGGERTLLGSLQKAGLRESITPRVESFGINLLEWTLASLRAYYGANVVITEDGAFEVPDNPVPMEGAFLVVLYDGENVAGFYATRASMFRNTDIAVADTNSLTALPIRVTALTAEGKKSSITVIPIQVELRAADAVATINADGEVAGLSIIDGGAGYTEAPAVTIAGDGTGATATATISDGQVIALVVTNPGSGYTSDPLVEIAAPASA